MHPLRALMWVLVCVILAFQATVLIEATGGPFRVEASPLKLGSTEDTYVHLWVPDASYLYSTSLQLRASGSLPVTIGLLRFTEHVSSIKFYVESRTNTQSLALDIYGVDTWPDSVTWANYSGHDGATLVSSIDLYAIDQWYVVPVGGFQAYVLEPRSSGSVAYFIGSLNSSAHPLQYTLAEPPTPTTTPTLVLPVETPTPSPDYVAGIPYMDRLSLEALVLNHRLDPLEPYNELILDPTYLAGLDWNLGYGGMPMTPKLTWTSPQSGQTYAIRGFSHFMLVWWEDTTLQRYFRAKLLYGAMFLLSTESTPEPALPLPTVVP